MLTSLDDIGAQVLKGGRGGKRPGAGRKRKDGSQPFKPVAPTPDFEVMNIDDLLGNGPPPPLVADKPLESGENASGNYAGSDFVLPNNPDALYAGARARKEAALAAKAELDFRVKSGLYLPRDSVREALAVSYQAVSQSLRAIPDTLERKLGITPEVADAVSRAIDDAMADLSTELERIHAENNAASNEN